MVFNFTAKGTVTDGSVGQSRISYFTRKTAALYFGLIGDAALKSTALNYTNILSRCLILHSTFNNDLAFHDTALIAKECRDCKAAFYCTCRLVANNLHLAASQKRAAVINGKQYR